MRRELAESQRRGAAGFAVIPHATPVVLYHLDVERLALGLRARLHELNELNAEARRLAVQDVDVGAPQVIAEVDLDLVAGHHASEAGDNVHRGAHAPGGCAAMR